MAKGYVANIEELTSKNNNFRQVLYTSKYSQLVLMSLKPNEEIGEEVHTDNDQFFRVESGEGKVVIDGNEYNFADGFAIVVPAGAKHNVVNISSEKSLKLYTIYSPAHHADKTVHATKQDAQNDSEHFEGVTTE